MFLLASMALGQQAGTIEDIRIHGNRRIPAETIRSRMFTRQGDVFDPASVERDFNSLWNAGYFDDLRIEKEQGTKGWILHVYVKEKPTIREIKYLGLNAVSQSDVLDKFKELKVGLSQESQFDPTKVKKAEVVLKELLAAHGHQFATIVTEVRQIPPAAVSITFNVKEGPTVKVGKIEFQGNKNVSARYLRSSMQNLHPIGIPHSIILENLFAKTYDATKLSEDAERVRFAYQTQGYFKAIVQDPKTATHDTHGVAWYFPFKARHGKAVDITVPVEEGDRYRLKAITFTGNKAITNTAALRRLFKLKDGDWFNRSEIGKGMEELRKAYGGQGYINETNIPETEVDEAHKTVTLKIDIDEGKQFFVRRIEFSGNTTTRDKVIRRELALEEGQVYNSQLWELSLLRLNQLNYFETLKPEQDSEVHQDVADNTVDINLKVKEKGKNSIGLNGGMSGMSGAFLGLTYETNNFLGLGETLSVQAQLGSYQQNLMLGFTEPYLFDKPIQAGFTAYTRNYKYNQAKQASINTNNTAKYSQLELNALQNYTQKSTGFTLTSSYALPRSFKRLSVTYSLDRSDITTYTQASRQYFEYLAFRSLGGADALNGIVTSKLTPNISSSTIDNPMRPHSGRSYFFGVDIAGLGGNVRELRPVSEYKQFFPMKGLHFNKSGLQTFGVRFQASYVTGFGGVTAPPFDRFFLGGDTDLRGFDSRAISPVAMISDKTTVTLTDNAGNSVPVDPNNLRVGYVGVTVPIQRLVYPGGDTSLVGNFEYRIPLFGPVTLAIFDDIGMNMAVRKSQLRLSDQLLDELNNTQFGCPTWTVVKNTNNNEVVQCNGYQYLSFSRNISILNHTNYAVRMSTGLELQVMMPVVNAPLRLYYAYNPLRIDTWTASENRITRSMFPDTGAGTATYNNAVSTYNSGYHILEPRKTLRFTVSTTF